MKFKSLSVLNKSYFVATGWLSILFEWPPFPSESLLAMNPLPFILQIFWITQPYIRTNPPAS